MNEIELILDNCLRRMAQGDDLESCLRRYPERAAILRPLLESADRLARGRQVQPSFSYKAISRAKLLRHAEMTRPRAARGFLHPGWRLSFVASILAFVMLASTTAFAQAALPGEALYGWKLGSENVWRAMALDQVSVDLTLADRRSTELTRVVSDPERAGQARDEFHAVLDRLEAEKDLHNGPRIDQALLAHQKKLSDAGIRDNKLDDIVHGNKK